MARTLDPGDRTEPRAPAPTGRGSAPNRPVRRIDGGPSASKATERTAEEVRLPADRPNGPDPSVRQPGDRLRQSVAGGRRVYHLSADERATLTDLGRFRVIAEADLERLRYGGRQAWRQDIRSLMSQRLIQRKTEWTGQPRAKDAFYSLTAEGKRLAQREVSADQALYSGFVKPAELRHDAAIYRMYHREIERISREGGKVRRVVLDFELKKNVYSPLAKVKALPPADYAQRQAEIARGHDLKIVNGHIALPDLRIEYETPSGSSTHVDLEVASGSYHGSHAAEKAAAGFRIYASRDTAARLSAALEEREITAEILSL